jgi:hypothetical protein
MERVMEKIEKWNKTKDLAEKRKADIESRAQQILISEKKKFDKIEKNQKEKLEDIKARSDYKKAKWETKVLSKIE